MARTLVYEPVKFEMHYVHDPDNPDAVKQLLVYRKGGDMDVVLLFSGDEVWLTGDSGKTADRWKI